MNSGLWSRPLGDCAFYIKEKHQGWYVSSDSYIKLWNQSFEGWPWDIGVREVEDFLLPPEMMEPMR